MGKCSVEILVYLLVFTNHALQRRGPEAIAVVLL